MPFRDQSHPGLFEAGRALSLDQLCKLLRERWDEAVQMSSPFLRNMHAGYDLDGCLFRPETRTFRLLERFLRFDREHVSDAERERISDFLSKNQKTLSIPYDLSEAWVAAGGNARTQESWLTYARDRFHTSEGVALDEPAYGAVESVCRLERIGYPPSYYTGRHPSTSTGTRFALEERSFPSGEVVYADPFHKDDVAFKRSVFERNVADLNGRSPFPFVYFDNEPEAVIAHQEIMRQRAACAVSVYVHGAHRKTVPLPPEVLVLMSFGS